MRIFIRGFCSLGSRGLSPFRALSDTREGGNGVRPRQIAAGNLCTVFSRAGKLSAGLYIHLRLPDRREPRKFFYGQLQQDVRSRKAFRRNHDCRRFLVAVCRWFGTLSGKSEYSSIPRISVTCHGFVRKMPIDYFTLAGAYRATDSATWFHAKFCVTNRSYSTKLDTELHKRL